MLGCSGSFAGPQSPASGYLLEAEDDGGRTWRVMLDLGNGVLGPLQRVCDPASLDAVLLSHLHPDHVCDISGLYVYLRYHPDGPFGPVAVWGPQGTADRIRDAHAIEPGGEIDGQLAVHQWPLGEPVRVGPLEVLALAVRHPVPAVGLRVTGPSEAGGGPVTLTYSGDTDTCDALVELARDADLLLVEAGFADGRDDAVRGVHLTGSRAGAVAQEAAARRVVLTHLSVWNDRADTLARAREQYSGPLELAEPGAVHRL